MEEQKNKEVKMQPKASSKQDNSELTNEQLKDMADKLFKENRWLRQQNQQMILQSHSVSISQLFSLPHVFLYRFV